MNAAPEIVTTDTARRYNSNLEHYDITKIHKQVAGTLPRHCNPKEDLQAEIVSTGQEIAASFFHRVYRLFKTVAEFANREPLLTLRREILYSISFVGFQKKNARSMMTIFGETIVQNLAESTSSLIFAITKIRLI